MHAGRPAASRPRQNSVPKAASCGMTIHVNMNQHATQLRASDAQPALRAALTQPVTSCRITLAYASSGLHTIPCTQAQAALQTEVGNQCHDRVRQHCSHACPLLCASLSGVTHGHVQASAVEGCLIHSTLLDSWGLLAAHACWAASRAPLQTGLGPNAASAACNTGTHKATGNTIRASTAQCA
jgi:hypothetical protein